MNLPRRTFTGIPVVAASKTEICEAIVAEALDVSSKGCDIHLLEANGLSVAETTPDFERLLIAARMVLPDGRWLELLTRRSARPLTQFRGEDLFRTLLEDGKKHHLRHFFVGATEEKLQRLFRVLELQYPGVTVAGHWVPPYRDLTPDEQDELDHLVTHSEAHIVWLGISTPRQDWEAFRLASNTKKVVIAVGAAFEFVSGDKKTAPKWASRLGVEWLYRMLSEPRRLGRRYVVGTVLFATRVFRYRREDVLAL